MYFLWGCVNFIIQTQRWSYFVGQVGGVFKVESRFNNYAAIA